MPTGIITKKDPLKRLLLSGILDPSSCINSFNEWIPEIPDKISEK